MSETFNWRAVLDKLTDAERGFLENAIYSKPDWSKAHIFCDGACFNCLLKNKYPCRKYENAELCRRAVEEYRYEHGIGIHPASEGTMPVALSANSTNISKPGVVESFVSECRRKESISIETLIKAQLDWYEAHGITADKLSLVRKDIPSGGFEWSLIERTFDKSQIISDGESKIKEGE